MDNSHLILLNYYKNYGGGSNNLIGGLPWYYYLWPGNWFSSNKLISSTTDNISQENSKNIKKKNINLPSLVKIDVKLYNPLSKGGYSREIIPIIENEYNLGNYNFKNTSLNLDFTIIKFMNKILYGAGTFTAVYKIRDNNLSINDPNVKDNIYILRLTTRDNSKHMYDSFKIQKEYKLFNKYLPKVYYYGNFLTSRNTMYYYTITKLYNDFPVINNNITIPKILSNIDKFVFLYNNVVMLNDLSKYNYTHFDYKLSNVGFEIEDNEINVILIDYDESTLQKINRSNQNFILDDNQNVITIDNTSMTHIPEWLSKPENRNPIIFDYRLPIRKFDKFAIGGLYQLMLNLSIQFRVSFILLSKLPSREILEYQYRFENKIDIYQLSNFDVLHLTEINYNVIPTYELILEIFSVVMKDKKKYLL
jgi:hypothetical protein